MPSESGMFPIVVILHGGSSNVKAHRSTSTYYAMRFVKNGIAALIFDKRGTGDSGGNVNESVFDDYVSDAIEAVKFLKQLDTINIQQVGIFGPSQGGRIGALAAARNNEIDFVVSISGPLVSLADLCYHSSMYYLYFIGITDSIKNIVDPLWQNHYNLVEEGDIEGLKELDAMIEKYYNKVDTIFLPQKSEELNDLGDFQPMYNSMTRDYISELSNIKVPWLSIYADFDDAVPVDASIKILKEQMEIGGNKDYEVKVIPNVNHMFRDIETEEYFPVENIAIEWILKILAIE